MPQDLVVERDRARSSSVEKLRSSTSQIVDDEPTSQAPPPPSGRAAATPQPTTPVEAKPNPPDTELERIAPDPLSAVHGASRKRRPVVWIVGVGVVAVASFVILRGVPASSPDDPRPGSAASSVTVEAAAPPQEPVEPVPEAKPPEAEPPESEPANRATDEPNEPEHQVAEKPQEPQPAPTATPRPKLARKPTPKPISEPAPKPISKPAPKPTSEPAPKPISEPAPPPPPDLIPTDDPYGAN